VPRRVGSTNTSDTWANVARSEITRYLEGERVLAHSEGVLERAGRVFARYRAAILLIAAYLVVRTLLLIFGRHP